ncbi:MAG: SoxR reducing system RseC family protein [Prevotella sp.]|nr:SoxR reducing system RseC family protein [Prevotella sp.]
MADKVTHTGIIDSIDGDRIHVRILQASACGECRIAGHCNASDTREKYIDVKDSNASIHHVGESVVISTDGNTARRATVIAYVIPLILMVLTLVLVLKFSHNEGMAALSGIGILVPYYFVIFLLRKKISSEVKFQLKTDL